MAHKSHELRPVTESLFRDGRGGRMYVLPRVFLRDIQAGTRSIFQRFDSAAQDMGIKGAYEADEAAEIEAHYDRMKQAMLRAIIRLQNKSPEDVEGIKRDQRKLMTVIEAIYQAPEQAKTIIEATKAMELVAKIRGNRSAHAYHAGVAAFAAMLEKGRGK